MANPSHRAADYVSPTEARLQSHEAVCAVRYSSIDARLKRLESLLLKTAGTLLVGMAGLLWTVLYTR